MKGLEFLPASEDGAWIQNRESGLLRVLLHQYPLKGLQMSLKLLPVSIAMFLLLISPAFVPIAHANSGLITCSATLTGSQETPPNASPGSGSGTFTYDTGTNTFTYSVTFSGLLGTTTASHIHAPNPPGLAAPVIIPLTTVPLGVTAGTFIGSAVYSNVNFVTWLLTGLTYINIHSSVSPGGEIRGQLACSQTSGVPEFSALGLLFVVGLLLPMTIILRKWSIRP